MKPVRGVTNADIANAIEALQIAIEDRESFIDSQLPPTLKNWDLADQEHYESWSGQLKRFRALRKKLLAIERAA